MSIEIANIKKSFGRTQVLNDISLDIPSGQMVALLGPSGSGKTTLLRIIAGLEHQTSGHIRFHGTDVSRLHARDRKVGFVFQHYALFRHMTVFDNIAFGLTVLPRRERPNAAAIKAKVTKLLEMVQLAHLADRYPAQLSGGQKQRVALARALAVEPQILLLDEPFGALDAQVRKELRRWLRQLHEELKFTSVFVTHDQEEATEVADRVVVMSQGNIEQADAPEQVWREPATRFVLEFMGEVNRLQGTIRGGQFHVGAHRWPLGYTPAYQGPVDLFLRPWEVDISRRTSLDSPLPVQVLEASPKGHYTQLVVQPLGWYNEPLTVVMHGDDAPQRGERLFVGLQHARLYNGDERIETRDEELALARFVTCRPDKTRKRRIRQHHVWIEIVSTLEQTIGNTPLVKLQRMGPDNGSEVWLKLEGNNPAGSVKDRAALSMIVEAEKRGEIKPGDVLIEATSGNTGIALAMIAALKGYRMKLLMPDNMSQERRAAMRAYGAELILVTKEQGMEGARDLALEMANRGEGKLLDQFNNPDNPYAHYTTTGPEIWQQTGGRITHFVSSMGTTGTITGVSRFMREQSKPVTIVGLQPEEGSSIPGIRRWPAEYLPGIFNASLVDEVLDIHQRDAENTMRELAVREGIFCGVSSGGAVAGALRVAKANPGAVVVAIICDRGDRYLSTGVFGEEHFSQGAGI